MNLSDRMVTRIPLENIWTSEKELTSKRVRYLSKDDIKELLEEGQVNFIIANCGDKLAWISTSQCFDFWKTEVQQHLAPDVDEIYLENFPDNYAYIASEWTFDDSTPIILLEKYH